MAGVVTFPERQRHLPRGVANSPGGLTHDLRNVMASLLLCAEVMAQPGVLTAGNEYLASEVQSVAEAAIGLLRRVGHLAGGRAGFSSRWAMTEAGSSGRITQVLKNLESMLRRVAGAGVQVDVECAPCWGRLAIPDEDLARVLMNLVRNASEAMSAGGHIRITSQMAGGQSFASSGQPLRAANSVTISVQDDGPGVPLHKTEEIFEPGFTTKTPASRCAETERGLGLAVARELVEMAGGALVLAQSARGARFEMEIPLTNVMQSWASRTRFDAEGGHA